ncbi:hypothetical protein H310_01224 [Aphanomyces invadans]|uniref:SH2 domain-containing protein n=1 Tax=Aphanomyces invadans TaxID=157072 RepID=A0A024US28_9STRA|nr:hypothetical protein H310_01224 [Aphanomyces invadans]ETW08697.1 hypothetical protein H310_01224 [Aphanomyces invadans]|eukprot:XP_008862502.1 hypothetical protein H310_01224 [Aphanomyces invadans]
MFVHLHSSPLVVRQSSSSLGNSVNANCQYGSNNDFQPIEILDVKEERRLLLQCLQECGKQIQWRSEVADVHTFRKVVSHGCRALHFSGHGVPGKVIFESATCEAHFLSQDELKTLLLAGDQSRPENAMRLVFVSACHSESVAEAFVSAGVPHVVVVPKEDKVLDQKAMEFSKAFYTALLAGHSVSKSFEIGQVQADIVTVSDTHQSRFKLLGTGNHATSHLFSDLPPGMYEDLTPPLPINECDAVAEAFIGRSLEVHAVFTALAEGARMVCLVGDAGMGKTEIALQACQYATERHLFERIFFLRWTTSATSLTSYVLARLAKCVGISQPPTNDLDGLCELLRGKLDAIRPDKRLNFLLVLDGCNHLFSKPNERNQLPQFQAILSQLLRRVRSLSLLLTSTNRLGGGTGLDCGVGERIISIEPMPPWDAALLFTVRAPRRLQVHEMGGGLAPFAKSSIMEALGGHARTICAVAQLLENHDLARDEGEFLHYLIPAIIAGLDPASKQHFSNDYCPLLPYTASSKKAPTRPPGASQTHDDLHHLSNLHIESKLSPTPLHPPSLHASISVASQMSSSPLSSSTSGGLSPQQLQLFAIKRRVEGSIASPEGCMIWSHAVVEFNKSTQNSSAFDLRHVREVAAINAVPFEYLGQQVSRFFASQLRQEAVLRPLSTRCMDFLSSSDRIWGRPGMSPNARGGFVDVQMFRAFWTWFEPLLSCIKTSRLWGFKHPRLLHGFISKSSCQNMLRPCVPGTFLLRFSETKPSCLVVVFVTAAGRVEMVPIEYKHSSPRQFEVYLHDSMSIVSFPTLHELVLNVHVLKYIYPHTPKHDVFQVPHDGAPRSS